MQHVKNIKPPALGVLFQLPKIPLDFNIGFLQSVPGIIKIAHTVCGAICLILIAYFCQIHNPLTGKSLGMLCSSGAAYLLLVTYGCFVTSLVMIATSTLSYFTASFLPKTAFEFAYHLISTILFLTSSINLLVTLLIENGSFVEPGYEGKIAASVFGLINGNLYGASTYFSFKALKEMS